MFRRTSEYEQEEIHSIVFVVTRNAICILRYPVYIGHLVKCSTSRTAEVALYCCVSQMEVDTPSFTIQNFNFAVD